DALAERLLAMNVAVLRVNTRGHDLMSTAATARGGKRQGAAYEGVDDCRHGLASWVAWLRERGVNRVGLLGHSLWALKRRYAVASKAPAVKVETIPGADHFYSGVRAELIRRVEEWLTTLGE